MSNAPEDSLDFAARVSLRAAGDADLELFELWRKNASPTEHQPEVSSERDIGDRRIPLVDEPLQPAQPLRVRRAPGSVFTSSSDRERAVFSG